MQCGRNNTKYRTTKGDLQLQIIHYFNNQMKPNWNYIICFL